ncbi:Isopentenyl-diphosphate Delta-isomerase [Corynebacterium kalinowskii]|uniref:Isopentenyl-diphosphate Delta-isomerase n=1 Tax=Corynebacterium kalinowskii TaxID=2675216 RepID=A0A6B8VBP1_9CORY|nr:isopentenyl-diphosphate Delta-isomerase [Corynebacterium kalinowskii]QGU01583.1 Isopentenyl-diphosphate Delta-isomerase [Corynebacterium kalinowskii]
MTVSPELVVLVAQDGTPTGTAPKASVHTTDTPLHLAFSCYVRNSEGHLLITRRSLHKLTWPGIWTNSMCGHPAPGESFEDAIQRRATTELGLPAGSLIDVRPVLPDFSYRATDSSGIVEWEICPVFQAKLAPGSEVAPFDREVDSYEWVDPAALISAVQSAPFAFSPWMVEQLSHEQLRAALLG